MIKHKLHINKTVIVNGLNNIIQFNTIDEIRIKTINNNGEYIYVIFSKQGERQLNFTKSKAVFNTLLEDIYSFFNSNKHNMLFIYKKDSNSGMDYITEYK